MISAQKTIEAHLAAIAGRDLEAYAETLHDDVIVVLPNGKTLEGREAVLEFHREWFSELDWTQKMCRIWEKETEGTLVSVYEADYHEGDYHARNLVSLVFTRVGDAWLLLHDQNTRL
ncbi:YybH family protein [Nonomuraea sp. NPDC059023]|uniref:Ketosteroid isomerase-like protein n=1 Tax=Nonomuraea endophytica TaxID=714136 RepID=A0A7W7ZYN1_9ACTN|nr:DUF4440 domain-containing protein [Nonomuraea endophytica]MBB5075666.1 ketosteroid isomerase-like protein [Nonomuraea endophytica]